MKRFRNAGWFTLKANNVYALLWRKDIKKMNQNNPFMTSFEGEVIAEPVVPVLRYGEMAQTVPGV
jgi:hypothetical protein